MVQNLVITCQVSENLEVRPHQGAATTMVGQKIDGGEGGFDGDQGSGSKGISTKESFDWSVTTYLLSLDEVPKVTLRMTL